MRKSIMSLLGALAIAGCDDTPPSADPLELPGADADLADAGMQDATADALADALTDLAVMADAAPEPPPPPERTACARQGAAPASERADALQWSDAHALSRFFGPHTDLGVVDDALANALAAVNPAVAYASALDFVCAVPVEPAAALPTADVTLDADGVAWVSPGTGAIEIPPDAIAVVLDLRDLPAAPGLEDALKAAAAAVLAEPLPRRLRVRRVEGLPDQIFTATSPYSNRIVTVDAEPWPGAGMDLPLIVQIDPTPVPQVAALAGAIRIARRGWLVGAPVFSAVAESKAFAVGLGGVSIRYATALNGDTPWPDVIEADAGTLDALEDWAGEPPAMTGLGLVGRAPLESFAPHRQVPRSLPGPAAERSMLIVAHGGLRRFFPYFDIVGDTIDERVLAVLDAAQQNPGDRTQTRQLLARFSHAFADGHAFIYDYVERFEGYVPFWVDHLRDGTPVVRRSAADGIQPGQVITTINGRPTADWYAEELERTSAASRGYALDLAARRYLEGNGPLAITVEDLDGTRHEREVERAPFNQLPPSTPWLHPTGFLDAAPGVFYLNMGNDIESDSVDLFGRMDAALPQAEAIIVDMRGYPGVDHYGVVIRLVGTDAMRSPMFEVPVWTGPDALDYSSAQYRGADFGVNAPGFAGPIILLVGPTSVSAAENFASMLTPFGNVTVMGRASAATNGNITGMNLPGGMGLTMTGMRILGVDGSPFHGIGIVPDIEIWPTAESLWNQTDVVLDAALERLSE